MPLPDILHIRVFFTDLCTKLRARALPWCDEMVLAIEIVVSKQSDWMRLPLLLKIFYERDYSSILIMAEALVAARQHRPWDDLFNSGKNDNTVYGDIFDAFVKKSLSSFREIPDGQFHAEGERSYDKGIVVNGERVAVEASVLGETSADRARRDAIVEKQRLEGSTFTTGSAYTSDPYELILRVTEKFLDKVAKNGDIKKSQLVEDYANLLFIGLPSLSAKSRDHDLSWALDALFSEAPWERVVTDGVKDVWSVLKRKVIDKKAADPNDPMAFDTFMKGPLWDRFKRVSGVVVFAECQFDFARVNYHCHPKNRISHSTMGAIETALAQVDWRPFAVTTFVL